MITVRHRAVRRPQAHVPAPPCPGRLDAGGDTDVAEDAGAEAGPCDGIDVAAVSGAYEWTSGVQGEADCEGLTGLFYDGLVSVEGTDYHFGGTCTDCPVPVTGDGTWETSRL